MAEPELPPLSEAQLEIMNLVWERGEVTVAEVWKSLAGRRKVARNTVQTLLLRLKEKGWLHSRTDGHAHRFRAAVPREATVRTMARRLVDLAFGGSTEGLLAALLGQRGVSPEEAERIRALLDQAEKKQQRKPR
jgi:BlaI family transcriptional regulator, penicillinase repressor